MRCGFVMSALRGVEDYGAGTLRHMGEQQRGERRDTVVAAGRSEAGLRSAAAEGKALIAAGVWAGFPSSLCSELRMRPSGVAVYVVFW